MVTESIDWVTQLALAAGDQRYDNVKGLGNDGGDQSLRYLLLGLPLASCIIFFNNNETSFDPNDPKPGGPISASLARMFQAFESLRPISSCVTIRLAGLAMVANFTCFKSLCPEAIRLLRDMSEIELANALERWEAEQSTLTHESNPVTILPSTDAQRLKQNTGKLVS
jgi:hypothetical protein